MEARQDGMTRTVRVALDRWEAPLLRYAASIVGEERARDVVQETFLRLWEGAPAVTAAAKADGRSRAEEGLAPWLFTVCRNRAIDIARKEGRMQLRAQPIERATAPPPDLRVAQQQDAGRVRGAVDALPERQRELVRLKYQGGLSYKEIAATTGLSVSNVGYLLHVAIKTLRTQLGGDS